MTVYAIPMASADVARIIAIVGQVASGKTTLANQLATILQWQQLSIDTERTNGGDWHTLLNRVRLAYKPTLVESVLFTRQYKTELAQHNTRVICTICPLHERIRRLEERNTPPYAKPHTVHYSWPSMRIIHTHEPTPDDTLTEIADWCQGGQK